MGVDRSNLACARAPRFCYPDRQPLGNRAVLNGIIFVLKTGINWTDLPAELDWGKVCRERLRDLHQTWGWERLHEILLTELHYAN